MNRFKVSKFKNAFCVNPKRETWITDVRTGSPSSCGNHIKASGAYMVYNADPPSGGCIGLLDVNSVGRQSQNLYLHHAHSSLVTDLDFSPFNDYLLATCSQDKTIKIWDLPEGGFADGLTGPVCSFQGGERRVENVLFHPTAKDLLTASVYTTVKIYDLTQEEEALAVEVAEDQLQGISWKLDGTLLATTSKDKKIRIVDPRANSVTSETQGHDDIRDSRVCWLGDRDHILSTGFNSRRARQVKVYDTRKFGSACCSAEMGQATGILMPLYDPDTQLVFLCGKGDQRIGIFEVLDGGARISDCTTYSSDQQQKGICLVPKKVLDVMSCEVGRLLQLTKQGIIPLKVEVPRTSHLNFYPELFPETAGDEPALSSTQWLAGENAQVAKFSLDPAKRKNMKPKKPANQDAFGSASSNQTQAGGDAPSIQTEDAKPDESPSSATPAPPASSSTSAAMATASSSSSSSSAPASSSTAKASSAASVSRTENASPKKKFTMAKTSKFKHLQGTLGQRKDHIFNIRNASINVFGESDGFHANKKWAAVPLAGSGGLITIIDINKPGKLPETGVPTVQNGSTMMDFCWDPFNDCRLAVACDDAKIRVWSFPEEGFEGTLTEPDVFLLGHQEKIYFIKFHPLASDVLLSASFDMFLKVWDLTTGEEILSLEGHTDQIFSAAWSPDGKRIATVCKDGLIRIYEPRSSNTPVAQGPGPEGSRGARIFWVHNGELLAVSGFEKDSARTVSLHDPKDLTEALQTLVIDKANPATLIPCYDPDTHVVFMTGKGERLVTCIEVLKEAPYFMPLSNYASPESHQALSFLPKTCCRIKDVEFMRALKLSKLSKETIHFTLPRVKKEYFQDDAFPDTKVTWEPVSTGADWFSGKNGEARTMNLCPEGMKYLSSIPKAGPPPKKYSSEQELTYKTDAEKREEIMSSMNTKLSLKSEPLPQDKFEGVDDDEWDD
eukprot:XP_011679230.1 PREDICTED: LOW QUALITY PROTEIN: coronin-7 [Strongylocentrotus purpuratus]